VGRTPSTCKHCRREREKLFLKGERCYTGKCSVERRKYPPGQHGAATVRLTEYAIRLREKQKAKRIYGLVERQFRKYFELASKKAGVTGEVLLQLLEGRLDNVVFRLGFAPSRQAARQIVRHGHVNVNNRRVNIPSYQAKVNDLIVVKSKFLDARREALKEYTLPSWLSFDENFVGKIVKIPEGEDLEKLIQVSLIVEHYSK